MFLPNLLLIAGTGSKSGKTTIACRIIEQFSNLSITAIKITPHFHETTAGLILLTEKKGYAIYEETNRGNLKDTARMLNAGASKVYFAKVWDEQLTGVFQEIMTHIPFGSPVVCESPGLRYFVTPGIFVIMNSDTINKVKNISNLKNLPHVMFKLEELNKIDKIPFGFKEGKWYFDKKDKR